MINLNKGVKAVKHYKNNKQKKPYWNMLADGVPKENGAYLISIHHTNTEDGVPEDEVWIAYWESDLRNLDIYTVTPNEKIGGFWNWGVGGNIELEQDVIAWRPLPRPAELK